jgi:hypothetical protein
MTPPCQRWRDRRDSYRPAGEVIATQDYTVASLPSDAVAKAFVQQHHYSGTYPAVRRELTTQCGSGNLTADSNSNKETDR